MKTKEEEYVDNMIKEYPYIRQYFPDDQCYRFLCRTLGDYGKLMYNQAIDECIKNSNVVYTSHMNSDEISYAEVDTKLLLKLKK